VSQHLQPILHDFGRKGSSHDGEKNEVFVEVNRKGSSHDGDTEWYSDELRAAKRDRRKAERRMRKSNLTVHREMFRDTCLKTNTLFLKCKKDYFSKKISEIERSIMFFDFNGACLSMMELSSELYSFTAFTTDPSRF
jgi:hypothetical protein